MVVTRYYADVDGLVDLRRSENIQRPVGAGKNTSDKQYKLHQSPATNDCLYRHMYRFNHIAVIDFDEVRLGLSIDKGHNFGSIVMSSSCSGLLHVFSDP